MKWWALINTCLILLLAVWIHVSLAIPKEAMKQVEQLRMEMDAYKSIHRDSIVVNVNNQIDIPKTIKITVNE